MDKKISELKKDSELQTKCINYGWGSKVFDVYNGIIVLDTPKKGTGVFLDRTYVFLDKYYNPIGVVTSTSKNEDEVKDEVKKALFSSLYGYTEKKNIFKDFPYLTGNISVKDIIDLAKRVDYRNENTHGSVQDMTVNGELVIGDYNSIYVSLLQYIKFLGEQLEQYYENAYHMKFLGNECPSAWSYLNSVMFGVVDFVNDCIEEDKYPSAFEALKYLGKNPYTVQNEDYYRLLRSGIDLIVKYHDLEINHDAKKDVESVFIHSKNDIDIKKATKDLFKILEVPYEEVKQRKESARYNILSMGTIDLDEWLSDKNKQDEGPTLVKKHK